ncbi:MAG: MarR family transcriptional regulator [Pseudomonadota bacterium]
MNENTGTDGKQGAADMPLLFALFNEMGIITQLATSQFNRSLPDGLHVSHFSILNHMSKRDFDETPMMLAEAFQVTKGTMTHSLGVLEKRGFVRLEPNPKDGRSKIVRLTDEGRSFVGEAIAALAPAIQKLTGLVDTESLSTVLPELRRLRETMDANREL